MTISTLIDAMLATGCSAEQMAAVVKAAEANREQQAAERRAKDAERQRKHRASRPVTVTARDEAVTACDVTGTGCDPSPSPKERSPTPPKEITPTSSGSSLRSSPAQPKPNVEKLLLLATGWTLPGLGSIRRLVADGHDLEGRVLPLARELAEQRRKTGQPAPESWGYLAAVVADPDREPKPASKPASVETIRVDRESPLWEPAAAAWKAERGKLPPCPDGRWYFPPHMVPALAAAA